MLTLSQWMTSAVGNLSMSDLQNQRLQVFDSPGWIHSSNSFVSSLFELLKLWESTISVSNEFHSLTKLYENNYLLLGCLGFVGFFCFEPPTWTFPRVPHMTKAGAKYESCSKPREGQESCCMGGPVVPPGGRSFLLGKELLAGTE